MQKLGLSSGILLNAINHVCNTFNDFPGPFPFSSSATCTITPSPLPRVNVNSTSGHTGVSGVGFQPSNDPVQRVASSPLAPLAHMHT